LTEVPYIPLTDRAGYEVYQTSELVGWPTKENPITGGVHEDELGARMMFLNIHRR